MYLKHSLQLVKILYLMLNKCKYGLNYPERPTSTSIVVEYFNFVEVL